MIAIPKVSVIIATYNSAPYLPDAIASVLNQTFQDFEVILIDDGSTDETGHVVEPFLSRVRLITQTNKGPAAARNLGIWLANGDYLVFLDADDLLLPDKLKVQVEYLDQYPQINVVYSNGYYSSVATNGLRNKKLFSDIGYLRKDLGSPPQNIKILAKQNAFPLHAAMVRKEAVLGVGGFDEGLPALEDWDLWYRIAQTGSFAYLDLPLVEYRQIPSGRSSNRSSYKMAFNQLTEKIEAFDGFQSLLDRNKSSFYFSWGIWNLEFEEAQLARNNFKKALKYNPYNILALGALILSRLIGKHTIVFYYWKKKFMSAK